MSTGSPLDFGMTETDRDGVTVLALRGDLDTIAAGDVVLALQRLLGTGRHVTLDLTEVIFMDSSGLAAIVRGPGGEEQRTRVTLRPSRHPQPQRLIRLTGVLDFFAPETPSPG